MNPVELVAREDPVTPPNAPWAELGEGVPPAGCISYYYSDPFSWLAARHVTRRNDNKSDPNIETKTYGLFSTCERDMRAAIVRDRRPHIFFVTNYRGERVLSGYYHVNWFAKGKPVLSYRGAKRLAADFHLAADEIKFIHPPVPLQAVAEALGDSWFARGFRTWKRTTPAQTQALLSFMANRQDRTDDFLREVHRLEHLNLRFHKVRYANWGQVEEFDWELARKFLRPDVKAVPDNYDLDLMPKGNQIGDFWSCANCGRQIQSVSPLKRCPGCGAVGWLVPKTDVV